MYPTNSVSYGQTSADVTALQKFLIAQGFPIAAGATGYFGDQTKAALAQWQTKNGISSSTPGYGTNWGPISKEAAARVTSGTNTSTGTSTGTNNGTGTITNTVTGTMSGSQPSSSGSTSVVYDGSNSISLDKNTVARAQEQLRAGSITLAQAMDMIKQTAMATSGNSNEVATAFSSYASKIMPVLLSGLGEVKVGNRVGIYNAQGNFTPTQTSTFSSNTSLSGGTSSTTQNTASSLPFPKTPLQPSQTFNKDVVTLQNWLVANKFMSAADAQSNPGYYGPKTTAAVLAYQKSLPNFNYSSGPGYWGPLTIAATANSVKNLGGYTTGDTGGDIGGDMGGDTGGNVGETNQGTGTSDYHYGKGENLDNEHRSGTVQRSAAATAGLQDLVSDSFLQKIQNDAKQVALYVHAMTYGGYTGLDIVKDMRRLELVSQGNEVAKKLQIINPTLTRDAYYKTPEGQTALSTATSMMPNIVSGVLPNTAFLDYGLNIPDELFKTLVPLLDRDSKEFKDAVANIKSIYFDLANAQLQATSEQEKAVADTNYRNFKEQLNTQYGIALSDDATKAWAQIEALEETFGKANISRSGFEAEAIDSALQTTRKQDQRLRSEKLTKEEQAKASYYTSSASSAEIAALTPEERAKYGLSPSADIKAQLSMANLKAKYPNSTEEELQHYIDSFLDGNGNYRSSIYSKYFGGVNTNKIAQKASAETEVLEKAADSEAKMYANLDRTDPYSSPTPTESANLEKAARAAGTLGTEPLSSPVDSQGFTPKEVADNAAGNEAYRQRLAALNQGTETTSTTTPPVRDYSPLKPGESLTTYYKRIGIAGY